MKELTYPEIQQTVGGISNSVVTSAICGALVLSGFYTFYASNFVDYSIYDSIGFGVVGAMMGVIFVTE